MVFCSFSLKEESCLKKKVDLFYEILVQSGSGDYGTVNIKLLNEGLVLSSGKETVFGQKSKIKFCRFNKIESSKLLNLFQYICKNNMFMDFEDQSNNDFQPIKIRIYDLNEEVGKNFTYSKYNEKIDGLLVLLNELIPEKFQDDFHVKRIK